MFLRGGVSEAWGVGEEVVLPTGKAGVTSLSGLHHLQAPLFPTLKYEQLNFLSYVKVSLQALP